MSNGGTESPGMVNNQLQYQRRVAAQSPSQADLNNLNVGAPLQAQGGNHFSNRHQSLDVVNSNKLKNKLQTRKRNAGQLNSITYDQGTVDATDNNDDEGT